MNTLRTGVISLAIVTHVLAQSSDIVQCIPDYQWSINSRGQTPCLVGAYLESSCGTPTSVNQVPPGNHYVGPALSQANPCLCNSVTYSVISACGGCQNRTFTDYATWTQNCVNVLQIGQFPTTIPNVTEVPSWAFLNISSTNNTFNALAAEQEAETHPPSPNSTTETLPQSTSTPPSSSTLAAPSNSPLVDDSGGLSSGAIAGITIGALVLVITALLLIFWMMLRARRRRNNKPALLDVPFSPIGDKHHHGPSFLPPGHAHTRSLSDPASVITPYVYGPSDVVHHEAASLDPSSVQRQISVDNFNGPTSPQTIRTVQSPTGSGYLRGYTGAAEV